MKKYLLYLLFLGAIFSCVKEDGQEFIRVRSKYANLINKWKIDKMYLLQGNVPGIQLGNDREILLSDLDRTTTIEFKKNHTVYFTNFLYCYLYKPINNPPFVTSDYYSGYGTWEFEGGAFGDTQIEETLLEKEGLRLSMDNVLSYKSKILRLEKEELTIVEYWPRQYAGYPGMMPRILLRLIPVK
jgi:hypothetical protein